MRIVLSATTLVFAGIFLASGPGIPLPVEAGTALRMEIEDLVEHTDLMLEARVVSQDVVSGDDGRIETVYALSVDRTFWGEDLRQREIKLPGGILPDGRGLLIPGLPRLSVGEDVILALTSESAAGVRMPIGLSQGKLRVVTDASGAKILVRGQADLGLVQPTSGLVREANGVAVFEYAAFIAQVEAAAATRRASTFDSAPADTER